MIPPKTRSPAIVLFSLLLTLGTVYTQFSVYGPDYLTESQAGRQRAIIGHTAPAPFQYRVLSAWLLEGLLRAGRSLGIASPVPGFILLRSLQNLAIFLLAALWYRRLTGGNTLRIALGSIFLAWGMSYAFRDGGLDFSVYFSAILCLLAALAISSRRDCWIPLITLCAALNQEISAVIPFAFLVCRIEEIRSNQRPRGRTLFLFFLSLLVYLGVFLGMRLHFGWRSLGAVWQHHPGSDLFIFNFTHTLTWAKLIWTLNILPLICLFTWRFWPSELKRWALLLLPVTFLVVPSYQWLSETRAVLVPLAVVFVPGALLLEKAFRAARPRFSRIAWAAIIVAFTLTTVYAQSWLLWPRYLRESQLERHREVMENRAGNPWQYRVLSEGVTEAFLRLGGALGIASPVPAFLFFRILQNAAIFLLATACYRRLKLSEGTIPLGLIAIAWGMTYATYNSDLHFSTYSEIVFYLLALLAVIEGRDWWIPPLTLLAALNRETAVFIPLFFLFSRIRFPRNRFRGIKPELGRRSAEIFLASVLLYVAAYFGLRWSLGWRSFIDAWGAPGLLRLRDNLTKGIGWQYVFLTVNAIPLLAVSSYRRWPKTLVGAFWGIALPWLIAHYAGKACLEETRFLLLPLAIVFIPGALILCSDRSCSVASPASARTSRGAAAGRPEATHPGNTQTASRE